MRRRIINAGFLGNLIKWLNGDKTPTPTPEDPSGIVDAHNRERIASNVPTLQENLSLGNAAQKHADWMAANGRLSHTGTGGSDFTQRIKQEGYRMQTGGENIAAGHRTVSDVMKGWMGSRGHRANILNREFKEIGVGRSGNYWCVVFATGATGLQNATIEEQPEGLEFPQ